MSRRGPLPPAPLSGTPWVGAREGGVDVFGGSEAAASLASSALSGSPSLAPTQGVPERGLGGEVKGQAGEDESPWHYEHLARSEGKRIIAGVDEVGRGTLAGPVVAAAVVLPEGFEVEGITDSKKLTPSVRESILERLIAGEAHFGIGIVDADEIDRINILKATHQAMRLALEELGKRLPEPLDCVYVDGLPVPGLHDDCRSLVRGDSRCVSIAAASIVAKVTRDRMMAGEYHEQYPDYGFARHKGYGTREHLNALEEHGPCPLHRRTFGPVAQTILRFEE